MAISSNNWATYLEQYLKTINAKTGAKLTAAYAVVEPRYQIHCGKCDVSITVNRPDDTSFDYSVQEFIKLHTHCTHEWDFGNGKHVWDGGDIVRCEKCHVMGIFGAYKTQPLPPNANAILKNIVAPGSAVIDDDPENAAKIKSAMAKYDAEMKAKQAIKVAEVQAKSKLEKAGMHIGTGINAGFSSLSAADQEAMIAEEKAKEQALKNVLQLLDLKEVNALLMGRVSGVHASAKPKSKTLDRPTGRKFR